MKPIVHFTDSIGEVRIGSHALVIPVDHPSSIVINNNLAQTSAVVKVNPDGFETLNTIYRKV